MQPVKIALKEVLISSATTNLHKVVCFFLMDEYSGVNLE